MELAPSAARITGYDFLDLGCSHGRSITFGKDRLGGRKGLGIDVDPAKVQAAQQDGFDVLLADASTLDPGQFEGVRFAIMSHFLEHLPTFALAKQIIGSTSRVVEDYIFIRQPYFEADEYLFRLGLKLTWSDWEGHTNKMSGLDFYRICQGLLQNGTISRFCIYRRYPIDSSAHETILPLSAGHDRHAYEPARDAPKPTIDFDPGTVFHEIACVITKRDEFPPQIRTFMNYADILFDSAE